MTDAQCVQFLQWALPRLRMRWGGFRKVRGQVCKRVQRRLQTLGLPDVQGYQAQLRRSPGEWCVLDGLCRITISRFYRDRDVFDQLCGPLPAALSAEARARDARHLDLWSVGCAGGEEPYSLALGWRLGAAAHLDGLDMHILATDTDPESLARARSACYGWGSVKGLPPAWREQAFVRQDDRYCLPAAWRRMVELRAQDIREDMPSRNFDLILCRNLVFTYFEAALQAEILQRLVAQLWPGGALVIGKHERLPSRTCALAPWAPRLGIYRRSSEACSPISA